MSDVYFDQTPLDDLYIVKKNVFRDQRGGFYRMYCRQRFGQIGVNDELQQINFSHASKRYTTRGFHFQYGADAEVKIVTCVRGEMFDVVVDLRNDSPTFMQSFSILLTEDNCLGLCIPKGFGHASQALCDDTTLLYFHTQNYNPQNEGGVNVCDSKLPQIDWPGPFKYQSERDLSFPMLDSNFQGIF
jgi:dTDP-4-dehydrorhamnose 3,5-epimerase